jgi:hypothetical protein
MIINIENFIFPKTETVLLDFMKKNNWKFLVLGCTPVVSTVSESTYGVVYEAEGNLIFCKHKPIEINKGKSAPRVCTDIQKTCKLISSDEFDKYFRKTNMVEIMILEFQDEKALFKK